MIIKAGRRQIPPERIPEHTIHPKKAECEEHRGKVRAHSRKGPQIFRVCCHKQLKWQCPWLAQRGQEGCGSQALPGSLSINTCYRYKLGPAKRRHPQQVLLGGEPHSQPQASLPCNLSPYWQVLPFLSCPSLRFLVYKTEQKHLLGTYSGDPEKALPGLTLVPFCSPRLHCATQSYQGRKREQPGLLGSPVLSPPKHCQGSLLSTASGIVLESHLV